MMDNTERARAEKLLIRFGESITIKDYGWALSAAHNIITQIEKEVEEKKVDFGYCTCMFPYTDSRDTFSTCARCHLRVNIFK